MESDVFSRRQARQSDAESPSVELCKSGRGDRVGGGGSEEAEDAFFLDSSAPGVDFCNSGLGDLGGEGGERGEVHLAGDHRIGAVVEGFRVEQRQQRWQQQHVSRDALTKLEARRNRTHTLLSTAVDCSRFLSGFRLPAASNAAPCALRISLQSRGEHGVEEGKPECQAHSAEETSKGRRSPALATPLDFMETRAIEPSQDGHGEVTCGTRSRQAGEISDQQRWPAGGSKPAVRGAAWERPAAAKAQQRSWAAPAAQQRQQASEEQHAISNEGPAESRAPTQAEGCGKGDGGGHRRGAEGARSSSDGRASGAAWSDRRCAEWRRGAQFPAADEATEAAQLEAEARGSGRAGEESPSPRRDGHIVHRQSESGAAGRAADGARSLSRKRVRRGSGAECGRRCSECRRGVQVPAAEEAAEAAQRAAEARGSRRGGEESPSPRRDGHFVHRQSESGAEESPSWKRVGPTVHRRNESGSRAAEESPSSKRVGHTVHRRNESGNEQSSGGDDGRDAISPASRDPSLYGEPAAGATCEPVCGSSPTRCSVDGQHGSRPGLPPHQVAGPRSHSGCGTSEVSPATAAAGADDAADDGARFRASSDCRPWAGVGECSGVTFGGPRGVACDESKGGAAATGPGPPERTRVRGEQRGVVAHQSRGRPIHVSRATCGDVSESKCARDTVDFCVLPYCCSNDSSGCEIPPQLMPINCNRNPSSLYVCDDDGGGDYDGGCSETGKPVQSFVRVGGRVHGPDIAAGSHAHHQLSPSLGPSAPPADAFYDWLSAETETTTWPRLVKTWHAVEAADGDGPDLAWQVRNRPAFDETSTSDCVQPNPVIFPPLSGVSVGVVRSSPCQRNVTPLATAPGSIFGSAGQCPLGTRSGDDGVAVVVQPDGRNAGVSKNWWPFSGTVSIDEHNAVSADLDTSRTYFRSVSPTPNAEHSVETVDLESIRRSFRSNSPGRPPGSTADSVQSLFGTPPEPHWSIYRDAESRREAWRDAHSGSSASSRGHVLNSLELRAGHSVHRGTETGSSNDLPTNGGLVSSVSLAAQQSDGHGVLHCSVPINSPNVFVDPQHNDDEICLGGERAVHSDESARARRGKKNTGTVPKAKPAAWGSGVNVEAQQQTRSQQQPQAQQQPQQRDSVGRAPDWCDSVQLVCRVVRSFLTCEDNSTAVTAATCADRSSYRFFTANKGCDDCGDDCETTLAEQLGHDHGVQPFPVISDSCRPSQLQGGDNSGASVCGDVDERADLHEDLHCGGDHSAQAADVQAAEVITDKVKQDIITSTRDEYGDLQRSACECAAQRYSKKQRRKFSAGLSAAAVSAIERIDDSLIIGATFIPNDISEMIAREFTDFVAIIDGAGIVVSRADNTDKVQVEDLDRESTPAEARSGLERLCTGTQQLVDSAARTKSEWKRHSRKIREARALLDIADDGEFLEVHHRGFELLSNVTAWVQDRIDEAVAETVA